MLVFPSRNIVPYMWGNMTPSFNLVPYPEIKFLENFVYLWNMNYIITESRLHQMIFKYLDLMKLSTTEIQKEIYFMENEDDDYGVLRYDTNDGWLFILGGFNRQISNLFSLSENETKNIISLWVENFTGRRVSNPDIWESKNIFYTSTE
jgi:hypothetical protein